MSGLAVELIFLEIRKKFSSASEGILGSHGLCGLGVGASDPILPPPEPSCGLPVEWKGTEGWAMNAMFLAVSPGPRGPAGGRWRWRWLPSLTS